MYTDPLCGAGPESHSNNAKMACKDVNTKDSPNELPRWPCSSSTGDEDQPILMTVCVSPSHGHYCSFTGTDLRKSNLQEEYFLDTSPVLDNTSTGQEHSPTQRPGRCGQKYSKGCRYDPDPWELPFGTETD
jgi:hypothetical protein